MEKVYLVQTQFGSFLGRLIGNTELLEPVMMQVVPNQQGKPVMRLHQPVGKKMFLNCPYIATELNDENLIKKYYEVKSGLVVANFGKGGNK